MNALTSPDELLRCALAALEQEQVCYCLLRDGERLEPLCADHDVDLLVQVSQLARLCAVLGRLGFVRLPARGHWPHHFFLAYIERAHAWLKLDVVTQVAFGMPSRALRTQLAGSCLARRRRCGPAFIPAPEDELVCLLMHCVLDKGEFDPARQRRLVELRRQITDRQHLAELLAAYWLPGTTWESIAGLLDAGDWPALLAGREDLAAQLASRDPVGTAGRRIRGRLLRKLDLLAGVFRPRALSVAVIAPDGAGKSTLIAAIQKSFCFSTCAVYMGLYRKGRTPAAQVRLPGTGFLGRLLGQWRQYLVARYHRARGKLVLFDRYSYDALLPALPSPGRFRQWRRRLLGHACPAPDLVVLLDAPGEVLFARKGEHSAEVLEQQRRGYLGLRACVPQMVVVDATRSPGDVCRQVTAAIWQRYAQRFDRSRPR